MSPIRRILLCTMLALLAGTAAARTFEESFQEIKPAQPTSTEGKIEVLEIFWYGCPHCYSFEPYLDKWMATKPADVEFVRMPGVLNPQWVPHARAYYTAQKLGVLDKIHMPLFHALHRDRKRIFTEDDLRDFFEDNGVKGEDFDRVYRSNEVDTRVKQALVTARGARVTGVPTVIVNGKYMTSGSLTGSFENLLSVIDQLIARERKPVVAVE
jgi:thiol:disulfide interchange protein DsbA